MQILAFGVKYVSTVQWFLCFRYNVLMHSLQLALKDAEKVLAIGSNSPRPYLLKAYALILVKPS